MFEQNFGMRAALIRALPCSLAVVAMNQHGWTRTDAEYMVGCSGPTHAHHVKTRGAGGTRRDLAPLCSSHHEEWHRIGRESFDDKHGIDMRASADTLAAELDERGIE